MSAFTFGLGPGEQSAVSTPYVLPPTNIQILLDIMNARTLPDIITKFEIVGQNKYEIRGGQIYLNNDISNYNIVQFNYSSIKLIMLIILVLCNIAFNHPFFVSGQQNALECLYYYNQNSENIVIEGTYTSLNDEILNQICQYILSNDKPKCFAVILYLNNDIPGDTHTIIITVIFDGSTNILLTHYDPHGLAFMRDANFQTIIDNYIQRYICDKIKIKLDILTKQNWTVTRNIGCPLILQENLDYCIPGACQLVCALYLLALIIILKNNPQNLQKAIDQGTTPMCRPIPNQVVTRDRIPTVNIVLGLVFTLDLLILKHIKTFALRYQISIENISFYNKLRDPKTHAYYLYFLSCLFFKIQSNKKLQESNQILNSSEELKTINASNISFIDDVNKLTQPTLMATTDRQIVIHPRELSKFEIQFAADAAAARQRLDEITQKPQKTSVKFLTDPYKSISSKSKKSVLKKGGSTKNKKKSKRRSKKRKTKGRKY